MDAVLSALWDATRGERPFVPAFELGRRVGKTLVLPVGLGGALRAAETRGLIASVADRPTRSRGAVYVFTGRGRARYARGGAAR